MTWNSTSNKFDVSVPASYGDSNVRTVLSNSAGTGGISWNCPCQRQTPDVHCLSTPKIPLQRGPQWAPTPPPSSISCPITIFVCGGPIAAAVGMETAWEGRGRGGPSTDETGSLS